MAMNSASQQAADFLLGATIIGAPLAFHIDKVKARETFADCMTSRGYNLVMPDGTTRTSKISPKVTSPLLIHPSQDKTVTAAKSVASSVEMPLPAGWSRTAPPAVPGSNNFILSATNITADSGLILSSIPAESVTDLVEFTKSRMAVMASMLSNPKKGEIRSFQLNDREASQFVISGVENNINLSYIFTVIKGDVDIAVLCSWTSLENFPSQRENLNHLAYAVGFSKKMQHVTPHVNSPKKLEPVAGLGDRDASAMSGFQPAYPKLAVDSRHQGTTILMVSVDEEGAVRDVRVLSTSGYHELDQAAVEAVSQWTFSPAVRDGKNVAQIARIPINFNLNQSAQ